MSLKIFHVIFISVSVVLLLLFGWWAIKYAAANQRAGYAVAGIISFMCAGGLIMYEILFIRKLNEKNIR